MASAGEGIPAPCSLCGRKLERWQPANPSDEARGRDRSVGRLRKDDLLRLRHADLVRTGSRQAPELLRQLVPKRGPKEAPVVVKMRQLAQLGLDGAEPRGPLLDLMAWTGAESELMPATVGFKAASRNRSHRALLVLAIHPPSGLSNTPLVRLLRLALLPYSGAARWTAVQVDCPEFDLALLALPHVRLP